MSYFRMGLQDEKGWETLYLISSLHNIEMGFGSLKKYSFHFGLFV